MKFKSLNTLISPKTTLVSLNIDYSSLSGKWMVHGDDKDGKWFYITEFMTVEEGKIYCDLNYPDVKLVIGKYSC